MALHTVNWFESLDRRPGVLSLDDILEWFRDHPLSVDDLGDYLVFRDDRYVRNLLHNGPDYQALVLCWRGGQRSPIHNHRGSRCGVKVLRGTATETVFERAPNGMIVPVRSAQLEPGLVTVSEDSDTHQMSNLQAGNSDLVTLHIYSPPLLKMDMYSLDGSASRNWVDPINDPFADGGGI